MADHNIDILLRAKDQASKTIRGVNKELGKTGKVGGAASRGLKVAGVGIAAGAATAVGIIALSVKTGLQDLATLESAVTSVDGAIAQVGLTGQLTGTQIAGWANEIEANVGAAFDDKDIVSSTATLLRYGKVTPKNIRPAMEVMTDLAAKTGSVESASTLLAKAMADPTKAAGKLARAGVILTKAEQKKIAALVKSGKVGEAQALILDRIAESTKGAALASQGPYARSLAVLSDVSEDARKALAIGFLPVLEKLSGKLSKALGDPAVVKNIENFGKGLAGGLDDLIDFGEKVPWGAIGTGLKTAAEWTGKLFDAFRSVPPETQALILSLAGLNKLTGGAPIKIAVDFAKEGLKGLFGRFFERGAPGNPMFVVVEGGGAGLPIPGGGKIPPIGPGVIKPAIGAGVVFPIAEFHQQTLADLRQAGLLEDIKNKLPTLKGPTKPGADSPGGQMAGWAEGREAWNATTDATKDVGEKVTTMQGVLDPSILAARDAVHQAKDATNTQGAQLKGAVGMSATRTSNATTGGTSRITTTSIGNTSRIVAGLRGIQPNVSTDVKVYVTGNTVTKTVTTQTRYGAGTGSAGSNDRIGGKG